MSVLAEARRPITIPRTSQTLYISFTHALNLRMPGEDTGDWHFLSAFFGNDGNRVAPLAGKGQRVDTTPVLGSLGVRDMSEDLRSRAVLHDDRPVYVANHYRAIADIAMSELALSRAPTTACVNEINAWLDTEEQIETVREVYLSPLRTLLEGTAKGVFDTWLPKVIFN